MMQEEITKLENEFYRGTVQISEYVSHNAYDTISRIDAYYFSKHISGEKDSAGRLKPFFNIVKAAVNAWYRATDIDRKDIKLRANKRKDWIDSFIATVLLRDWMRRENFGRFLNQWGRTLAKYGSAIIKITEKDGKLHMNVIPFQKIIFDPIDFYSAPVVEIIELTEAQLRERVQTHNYDAEAVEKAVQMKQPRTTGGKRKEQKSEYITAYEVHGVFPESYLDKEGDPTKFTQQIHVVVKGEDEEAVLFSGEKLRSPYLITHLIEEDGRTLAVGAIEDLFDAQWMVNHSQKSIKDILDFASKVVLQTSDKSFKGRNVGALKHGTVLVHSPNEPLTLVNTAKVEVTQWQNHMNIWRSLGREITSVSEAMLGETPKSGTAWRQTEAILRESHSLFEIMRENKGLQLEELAREFVLPHFKKQLNTTKEVAGILEENEIQKIDALFLKKAATKKANKKVMEAIVSGETLTPEDVDALAGAAQDIMREGLSQLGAERFFAPSEVGSKTWKEQFKDLEWNLEIDITGEQRNIMEAMATLNTALKVAATPGFEQSPRAQYLVGKILELAGALSPLEYQNIPAALPVNTQNINGNTQPEGTPRVPETLQG